MSNRILLLSLLLFIACNHRDSATNSAVGKQVGILPDYNQKGIGSENIKIEGYYAFQFRISTWNWSCIDRDHKVEVRIKDGVPQKDFAAAYGWIYKVSKVDDDGHYKMIRYSNRNLDEFNHETQKGVSFQISKDGKVKVEQTFEYGIGYVNTQDSLKINGALISKDEIKGNYLEYSDVKTGSLKSCEMGGEYSMKKVEL